MTARARTAWLPRARRASRRWIVGSLPRAVRRSMRLRVVGLTLLLGTVVVLGVGTLVLADVANGLAERRTETAFAESLGAVQQLQAALDSAEVSEAVALEGRLDDLLVRVEGSPGPTVREAVLLRALDESADADGIVVAPRISNSLVENPVTPALRERVVGNAGQQQAQVVSVPRFRVGTERVPAVVVGSLVEVPLAGRHELYLVYRMDDQVATLRLVERAFVVGGVALVALVGTIAWLVARIVVSPVSEAARTAERLAAGELDRRMTVSGEDEVARLAASFNIMAASLQAQITRLETLSRLQQVFVSDVSHELRTPLTTMRMAADVLADRTAEPEGVDPDLRRSVVLLGSQMDRFESLLADLLEVSRFDAGAAILDAETVDLGDVVRQCVELMRPVAERHGVDVVVRTVGGGAGRDAGGRVEAQVDPRRLSRIVRNLLSNAVEHAEGRPVVVTVAGDATAVAVGVRDSGSGMAPEQLERVFDRFWRGDPSRRRTLGGSGLGLAIALEDARLHGGRLEVWSAPGAGAHFVVTLPRRTRSVLGAGPLEAGPPSTPLPVTGGAAARREGSPVPGVTAGVGA